jgi:hypothetical protein
MASSSRPVTTKRETERTVRAAAAAEMENPPVRRSMRIRRIRSSS